MAWNLVDILTVGRLFEIDRCIAAKKSSTIEECCDTRSRPMRSITSMTNLVPVNLITNQSQI
jgi:hypothetical protein